MPNAARARKRQMPEFTALFGRTPADGRSSGLNDSAHERYSTLPAARPLMCAAARTYLDPTRATRPAFTPGATRLVRPAAVEQRVKRAHGAIGAATGHDGASSSR